MQLEGGQLGANLGPNRWSMNCIWCCSAPRCSREQRSFLAKYFGATFFFNHVSASTGALYETNQDQAAGANCYIWSPNCYRYFMFTRVYYNTGPMYGAYCPNIHQKGCGIHNVDGKECLDDDDNEDGMWWLWVEMMMMIYISCWSVCLSVCMYVFFN